MKKGNHKSAILALPIVLSLAMVGCGSGGGGDDVSTGGNNGENGDSGDNNNGNGSDGSGSSGNTGESGGSIDGGSQSGGGASTDSDEGENASQEGGSDAQPVVSSVWAGATCSEYDVGIYFKSLYQFGGGGELLTGAQMYQDEACTTPGSGYKKPRSNDIVMITYSIAAMETLADGTNGYPIHLERTIEWPEMPEPPEPDGMDEECDPEVSVYACETDSDGDIADDG